MHRDIISKMNRRCDKSPLYSAKIPFCDRDHQRKYFDECYFALVHEMLDFAVSKSTLAEFLGFGNNYGLAKTFEDWKHRVGILDGVQNVLACGLWGDDAAFNTRESLCVLLFNVLSGVHNTRYWICAFGKKLLCKCGCGGRCTMDAIWDVVSWDFGCLLSGLLPFS